MGDVGGSAVATNPSDKNVYVSESRFGRGVFAARQIRAGEVILEFAGPLVHADEQAALGTDEQYLLQLDQRLFVLPEQPARYVNHSCGPNAGLKQDRVLAALHDIATHEEITFDYSTSMEHDPWTMECACGSPQCRGRIDAFSTLAPTLKAHYLRLGVVQRFIAEAT